MIISQPTASTATKSKNTNVISDQSASDAQFTAAAQAANPLYQPDTNSFDINKYMFDQGIEYGWQDPLAQEIFNEYSGRTPYTTKSSDYWLERAAPFEGSGSASSYSSPLDPREWGGTFGGDVMDEMAAEYEKRALAGTTATGEPLAGLAEGDPTTLAAGGSYHSLTPDIIAKMWEPQPVTAPPPKLA